MDIICGFEFSELFEQNKFSETRIFGEEVRIKELHRQSNETCLKEDLLPIVYIEADFE